MNRFRKESNRGESPADNSVKDNDPFDQLKMCKDKLKDISDILKNLSNKL